jgi:hypothetical protein
MLIVKSNKEWFDKTGWRCAIEDIINFYFPSLANSSLKVTFEWGISGKDYRCFGSHAYNEDFVFNNTKDGYRVIGFHDIRVLINGNEIGNYEALHTLLHELRHTWQYEDGLTEATLRYKGLDYWNHPKEVDARNFANENIDEAYTLVKEYLA